MVLFLYDEKAFSYCVPSKEYDNDIGMFRVNITLWVITSRYEKNKNAETHGFMRIVLMARELPL